MMKELNMFEYAVRNKLRFPFKGMIHVEDLWDLRVEDLDKVFKALNGQVKAQQEESLLSAKSQEDKALDVQIEIVKYIVKVKLEEQDARLKAFAKREQKQKIMSIIANKKDEALQNCSIEDLEKMLAELED